MFILFLVCLIEQLTSVFINKYYTICQNLIKKRLVGPQKMPSKLCNVGKIHDSNKREFKNTNVN